MLIWVTFSDVCVQCPSCCGGTPCHRWTPGFPRKHLRFLDKKWELQGDKLVPGQDHTGRELLGWSEIIYSAPQPQGRLSSTLVPPSRCYPAVKSSRETGSAFLPSMSKYWFCFHYLTWMFLLHFKSMTSLHLWLVHFLQVSNSTTEVCWTFLGEPWHLQWPEGVQASALSPPSLWKGLGTTPACDLPSCCLYCRSRTHQHIWQVDDHLVPGVCIFFIPKL